MLEKLARCDCRREFVIRDPLIGLIFSAGEPACADALLGSAPHIRYDLVDGPYSERGEGKVRCAFAGRQGGGGFYDLTHP
jgi:hypothetical protein